ncbi:single-stranded-DNA-specific exonuclease [Desulfohalotomaculum tongense]|uniref:single-stranded-DNA-specific exonuclease RecJ n=1 Tax=Desulforadius tongensis TaxID=1216062 RepID=UPI0019594D1C|nr:single-stranded-DNA-specific exonuclease RecJ [Desulforadius tongensis]MBM7855002.1 single-stranded-DNA-specific exonuclease [Desulforadius tongensis]
MKKLPAVNKTNGKKIWKVKSTSSPLRIILANQLNISEILAQMLINRGIHTVEEARAFLNSGLNYLHDPMLMKDMDKALAAVMKCLRDGQPILVHGDYDVDGISATALLVNALHRLGGVVDYYIPQREQGYGLHGDTLRWAAEEGYRLVITVDCGITALEEAELAGELGLTLVITDHHEPGEQLPRAEAVVNPKRPDCRYPFQELAGVGVAMKLVQAVYNEVELPNHAWYDLLDVACLGTVADIVPLLGENRIIVKHGLEQLRISPNLGLAALKEVSGVGNRHINTADVGFALAPRLNAAGRVADPRLGVELLLCPEPERAREIARNLDKSNKERQNIEMQVLEEALAMIEQRPEFLDHKVLVLAAENWHPGVIGIVASRLLERYHRPVLLISLAGEEGKGSARSIDGLHLYNALEYCKDLLTNFGGHEKAAGFSIPAENVDCLRQKINEYADRVLDEESLLPSITVDKVISLDELTEDVVQEMALLAPFGHCNPGPVLGSREVQMLNWRLVGENQNHLKIKVRDDRAVLDGIGFNLAAYGEMLAACETVDLAFVPEINEWNGRRSVQLKVKDICRRAAVRSEGISCRYFSEDLARCAQGLLQNKRLRLSSPDYLLEKLEFYKQNGPVDEPVKEMSTEFWHQITLHDHRECPDRLGTLVNIIGHRSVVILVNSGYQVIELAHTIALRNPELAHRIGYFCRGMPEEAAKCIRSLATPESGLVLVTTPRLIKNLNIKDMGRVILYYPPFSAKDLQTAAQVTGLNGDLYFMFGTADIAAATKALSTLAPERDCLVALYRYLIRRVGMSKVVELPVNELMEPLTEDGGAMVEDYTLALSMRIFAELGLLKFAYKNGIYQVKMLPRPSHKLDLEISKTFRWTNNIALEGLQFVTIIVSGNLKSITKLPYL